MVSFRLIAVTNLAPVLAALGTKRQYVLLQCSSPLVLGIHVVRSYPTKA